MRVAALSLLLLLLGSCGYSLAFNIAESSLEDLISVSSKHIAFVGSFQAEFEGSEECDDACIYKANRGVGTDCASYENFFGTQISISPAVWAWETSELPAGEYNVMVAVDELCWEAHGKENDMGVMEPVPFTIPTAFSTVRMLYYEETQRVTAHVSPLLEQFNCDGKPYYSPDFNDYGTPFQDSADFEDYEGYFVGEIS